MTTAPTSAEALQREIQRLQGAINRRKTGEPAGPTTTTAYPRSSVYVNPNYNPPVKASGSTAATVVTHLKPRLPTTNPAEIRDVIIDGVAFESSGRSLVRKDLPKLTKPPSTSVAPPVPHPRTFQTFLRNKTEETMNPNRTYKPKVSRRGRGRFLNRNMTLDNTRRPYQSRRLASKRKYSDKPCSRFTTTGSCNRGLTCMYQHDPSKIAICWNFLQGNCPHTAETCALSHDPTPERTPLCVHFANNGRCTRVGCLFPHVHVGLREGICRDFAVLGYCDKGLDCDKQHVRECPDFAEKGQCTTKGCKLPHVIRANRNRKAPPSSIVSTGSSSGASSSVNSDAAVGTDGASSSHRITAEDGQLGDEFISLTFNESESDESDDDEERDDDDDDADSDEEGRESHSDDVDVADE